MSLPQVGLLMGEGPDLALLEQFLVENGHRSTRLHDVGSDWESLGLVLADEAAALEHLPLLNALKAGRNVVPILMLIDERSTQGQRWLSEGMVDDILRMPFAKVELLARLRVFLRLSQQSRNALKKFERLFQDAGWGFCVVDPISLQLQAVNEAYARMNGYTVAELESESLQQLIGPLDRHLMHQHIALLLQRGALIFETTHQHKDGRNFAVEVDATVYRDAKGGAMYLAAYVRDVTERKRAERALSEALKEAEQANQAKTDFLANMSHEMRNPLNGILATMPLLSSTGLSPEQTEYASLIAGSAEDLLELVTDILDLTNIQAGSFRLENRPVQLHDLIDSLMRPVLAQATAKRLQTHFNIDPRVPLVVLADPLRLRQVLLTLLLNGVKFTESGHIELNVELTEPGMVEFAVKDTGVGIPPENQESVFAMFSQSDNSTTRRFGGAGVGLAICRPLVQLMDGRLTLTSTLGQGSCFRFQLPLLGHGLVPPLPVSRELPVAGAYRQGLKVLLVEDNPINQRIMTLLLDRLGHHSTVAANGRDGVQKYLQSPYDVVLMDLQMPVLSGFDATAEIRKLEREEGLTRVPIIALTARAQAEDRQECLRVGMDDYQTKPLSIDDLVESLERLIPNRQAVERNEARPL